MKIPQVIIRKKVRRSKGGSSEIDAEINEMHSELAELTRKLQRLRKKKRDMDEEETDEDDDDRDVVEYVYQFRGPQPPKGGGGLGGFCGGGASLRYVTVYMK